MIYASSPTLEGLRYVVLDEVHYLQDAYRGPVWEEVIIHTPPEVDLVCLSATVSNAEEFADWIKTVRGDTAAVIEERRPVELRHLYMVGDRRSEELHLLPTFVDGMPNREAGRLDSRTANERHWKGGGRHNRRSGLHTPRRADVVERLAAERMLPAIYFIFSRMGCDDAVRQCLDAGLRLTTAEEREAIRAVVESRTTVLSDDDLEALGYGRWLAGLEAGLAAHHAGMVPPFKEAVEECFSAGLVKAVFATETLALGINMPARTVVIEKLSKFTGERHEFLTPGEYTQLTGRAGRRGIDELGNAVVLWSPFVPFDQVAALASKRTYALSSSFHPTYNMAANLVRRYPPDAAHHLLNLSFAQYGADREVVTLEARVEKLERALRTAKAKGTDRVARIEKDIRRLERRIQGRAESLARQFDRVLRVLQAWDYVDGWNLTEAGEQLVRIYHESDLLVVEALRSGLLDAVDPPSVAALASAFTYESRGPGPAARARGGRDARREQAAGQWFPSAKVRQRWRDLESLAADLNRIEEDAGLPLTRTPDPGFVVAAHAWASGRDLAEVIEDEDFSGGDFVRNVKQLIDLLRQIGDVAPDDVTAKAARQAADRLFRGVVVASSVLGS
jgi:superfamily II RNA helicase